MTRLAESRESLWMLTVAPTIWAAHFLFSYVTAAVYCAKAGDPLAALTTVRVAIGVYTAVALLAIAAVGWSGYRAHRLRGGEPPHDADSPEDRHRFMGLATMLLAVLSAVAVVYAALVAVFVRTCQ
jgi:hypothetical protein